MISFLISVYSQCAVTAWSYSWIPVFLVLVLVLCALCCICYEMKHGEKEETLVMQLYVFKLLLMMMRKTQLVLI